MARPPVEIITLGWILNSNEKLLTERVALLLGESFDFVSWNSACMCYYYVGKASPKTLESRDTKMGNKPNKNTEDHKTRDICEDSAFYHKTPKQKSQQNVCFSYSILWFGDMIMYVHYDNCMASPAE